MTASASVKCVRCGEPSYNWVLCPLGFIHPECIRGPLRDSYKRFEVVFAVRRPTATGIPRQVSIGDKLTDRVYVYASDSAAARELFRKFYPGAGFIDAKEDYAW